MELRRARAAEENAPVRQGLEAVQVHPGLPSAREDTAPKAPSPEESYFGELEKIRSDPKNGAEQSQRDAVAERYSWEIGRLTDAGFELPQAMLVQELRKTDIDDYIGLVSSRLCQGMTPQEAKESAQEEYRREDQWRLQLIRDHGVSTLEDYEKVKFGEVGNATDDATPAFTDSRTGELEASNVINDDLELPDSLMVDEDDEDLFCPDDELTPATDGELTKDFHQRMYEAGQLVGKRLQALGKRVDGVQERSSERLKSLRYRMYDWGDTTILEHIRRNPKIAGVVMEAAVLSMVLAGVQVDKFSSLYAQDDPLIAEQEGGVQYDQDTGGIEAIAVNLMAANSTDQEVTSLSGDVTADEPETDVSESFGLPEGYLVRDSDGYVVTAAEGENTSSVEQGADNLLRVYFGAVPSISDVKKLENHLGPRELEVGDKLEVTFEQLDNMFPDGLEHEADTAQKYPKNYEITGDWPVDNEFKQALIEAAKGELDTDPDWLLAMMDIETGGSFSADEQNDNSSATGIFQKMADADGKYYGMTRAEFSSLSAVEQIPYMVRFFQEQGLIGKLNTYQAVYTGIAAPAVLARHENPGLNTIVYYSGSDEAEANSGWQDSNGNVTVGTLGALMEQKLEAANVSSGLRLAHKPDREVVAAERVAAAEQEAARAGQAENGAENPDSGAGQEIAAGENNTSEEAGPDLPRVPKPEPIDVAGSQNRRGAASGERQTGEANQSTSEETNQAMSDEETSVATVFGRAATAGANRGASNSTATDSSSRSEADGDKAQEQPAAEAQAQEQSTAEARDDNPFTDKSDKDKAQEQPAAETQAEAAEARAKAVAQEEAKAAAKAEAAEAKRAEKKDAGETSKEVNIQRHPEPLPPSVAGEHIDPKGITLHWWGGSANGNIDSLANTLRNRGLAVQFGITQDGEIYQMMENETDLAYHARGANQTTFGIEIEGLPEHFGSAGIEAYPEKFEAVVALVRYLSDKYNIPTNSMDIDCGNVSGIHPHHSLNGCPGAKTKTDLDHAYFDAVMEEVRKQ